MSNIADPDSNSGIPGIDASGNRRNLIPPYTRAMQAGVRSACIGMARFGYATRLPTSVERPVARDVVMK